MTVAETLKRWWHKLGSPRWFYEISGPWQTLFALLAVALLVAGTVWGLAIAISQRCATRSLIVDRVNGLAQRVARKAPCNRQRLQDAGKLSISALRLVNLTMWCVGHKS